MMRARAKHFVISRVFTLGHLIHVYDWRQREVGAIRRSWMMTLMPQFEIEMNGVVLGEIQKKFTFFLPRYEVDLYGCREGDFGWGI